MTNAEPMTPDSGKRSLGLSFSLVFGGLYLPFAWILFVDATESYRLAWLKLWPVLPGFVPGALLFHPNDAVEFTAMGVVAVALLAGLTWLGAGLALGVIGGAMLSHLTVLGIEVQGDHGLLFGLAVVVAVCSAILLFIYRRTIPVIGNLLLR